MYQWQQKKKRAQEGIQFIDKTVTAQLQWHTAQQGTQFIDKTVTLLSYDSLFL